MFGLMSAAAYAVRSYLRPPAEPVETLDAPRTPERSVTPATAPVPQASSQSVFAEAVVAAKASAQTSASGGSESPAPVVNRKFARYCLGIVEDGLARQIQHPTGKISPIDRMHVVPLVALANAETPDLNAHTVDSEAGIEGDDKWPGFLATVEQMMKEGTQSARFLVTLVCPNHIAAADYRLVGDRASIIVVEPAKTEYWSPSMLYFSLYRQFSDHPKIDFALLEADIQKSPAGCTMFSYSLMKKMFKEHDYFQTLHERNVAGDLPVNQENLVEVRNVDALLPPSFMKYAQSRSRIERYLEARPDMAEQPVNKRGETLTGRWIRSRVTGTDTNGKTITYNRLIEEKRRDNIARLLDR